METKFAVIADRDDNAGDGAVFLAVDREILDAFGELVAALLEPGGFGHQLVGPLVLGDFLEFREALLDALDFPGDFGRKLGRLRPDAAVLRGEAVFGIEHRLVQAQEERNSAAFASSFSIASRRTSAASSMKPSSSPLKRSRVTVPPAAS